MTDNDPNTGGTPPSTTPAKKGPGGKIVVRLSSVAKPPPVNAQPVVVATSQIVRPPPLPVKNQSSVRALPLPVGKVRPPPLPVRLAEPVKIEPKKAEHKLIPPIKLNPSSTETQSSADSIFADNSPTEPVVEAIPKGWKSLEPGELEPLAGNLQGLDVFSKTTPPSAEAKPAPVPESKPEEKKETSTPPPAITVKAPEPVVVPAVVPKPPEAKRLPPPLPISKPVAAIPHVPHHAPPMLEKSPDSTAEKRPMPHLPSETRKEEADPVAKTPDAHDVSTTHKAPALISTESSAVANKPPALPLKSPAPPLPVSPSKLTGPITLRVGPAPVALPLPTKAEPEAVKVVEAKPALRPPVLPSKTLAQPKTVDPIVVKPASEPVKKADETVPAAKLPPLDAAKKATEAVSSTKLPPIVPALPAKKAPLPLTRAERAQKRRAMENAGFYVVFVLTLILLAVGGIYFGRETQVEGQVIPPAGMTLSNEVWIVGDFRELSSGIAEDLAAERTPLKQEIQEKLDHVQRVQADIAAREERIRLLQQQIQSSKDEVVAAVKQAREATQQLWDGPGADLDDEYNARLDELDKTIAERAKSLNLNYQPDETYRSPEVWANAYRLALYGITSGVDSGKELQWLSDQMKQWRDFLKSMDDKKEQLREKAAQLKLEPAPKISDLNNKIDDLQHHIDSTMAEEDPLKAELAQAQADLTTAQTTEAGLDDKYYKQLYSLPEGSITDRMNVRSNGRFTWAEVDKSKPFAEGEKEHHYWIFARATRTTDGRQYWALGRFTISKNETVQMVIEPSGFVSTKAILRPDLSPDEQDQ